MGYRVRSHGNRWVIIDNNDEIAGSFKSKDMANQIVETMLKNIGPAKKVKKTKKSKKTEKK